MSLAQTHEIGCSCRRSLRAQLHDFRRRVWTIKMVEAVCAAAFGVAGRVPADVRARPRLGHAGLAPGRCSSSAAAVGLRIVPLALYRWVWRNRRLEQLARLLAPKHPQVGDQLLGVIELVRERLRAGPVAGALRGGDRAGGRGRAAARLPRRRAEPAAPALGLAGRPSPAVAALGLLALFPAAAANAWARLLAPWSDTPALHLRRGRAAARPLVVAARRAVLAHGRSSRDGRPGSPAQGVARLGDQPPVAARSATAATSSSCRRRSTRLARRPHRRRRRSASASSRRCGPS